jgi:ribose transport system ATP-binding protein
MNLVEMSRIAKSFGSTAALKGVSFELQPGFVHALMGENGAGKSTLMKILAGVHQPDSGEIRRNGKVVSFAAPKDALDAGISTVFQELSLLPNMTIAENMFLGREPTNNFGRVDHAKMNREAKQALAELGLTLNPATLVSELSIAERQFVEIARGIKAEASIFVLDEPTAALNAADVEMLNRHIRRLKSEGKAIVYISHRMDEIFEICDLVTVLKDGELVGTRELSEMTPQSLIAMMVGRELADLFPRRGERAAQIVLSLDNCQLDGRSKPFSLSLERGEIVALAGLEGQGQQKILRSIVGQYAPVGGRATIKGRHFDLPIPAARGVRKLLAMGVAFVPEDRKEDGLFLGLPIGHNIAAALHAGRSDFAIARSHRGVVASIMEQLRIKARSAASPAETLSGGNQQKVLLGRYLAANTDILLIEEPTRGVDIGAKSEIYRLLREFADKGGAVLVLSRETIELIGLCDRICVVHGDTIVRTMPATEATEHNILDAALSA